MMLNYENNDVENMQPDCLDISNWYLLDKSNSEVEEIVFIDEFVYVTYWYLVNRNLLNKVIKLLETSLNQNEIKELIKVLKKEEYNSPKFLCIEIESFNALF